MLAVRPWLAPDNRSRRYACRFAGAVDALAIALHVALLEIGGKPVHILIVRQYGMRLSSEEVVIPDAHQRQDDGQILFKRRSPEMLVHLETALEQFLEIVHSDVQRYRQPDCRPE